MKNTVGTENILYFLSVVNNMGIYFYENSISFYFLFISHIS